MTLEEFKLSPAYQYALDVVEGKFPTNKYIKILCNNFLWEIDNQESIEYVFDLKMYSKAARKFKGKTVKPEKPQKKNMSKALNLTNS